MATEFFRYSDGIKMSRLFIIPLLSLIIATSTSCGNRTEKAVKATIGKTISFHPFINDSSTSRFTVLRIVDNPTCTSCQLKMGEWRVFRRQIQKDYGHNIDFRFVINTSNKDEALQLLKLYKFDQNSIIETDSKFCSENSISADLGNDFVLLLDSAKTVIFIGNPCESPKAEKIFNGIFSGEIAIPNIRHIK